MGEQNTQWQGKTDGTSWMHKSLTAIMRVVPLRLMYLFVDIFVVPFYMLFSKSYKTTYGFYKKRMNHSTLKSFFSVYANFSAFSKNVLDKFKMYSGGKFLFDIENYDIYDRLSTQDGGFLILSAHVGNYELAGYALRACDKPFNVMLFSGEAETIMNSRHKMFENNNIHMIPVGNDMSHLIALNNALSNGESVSIPADRFVGEQKQLQCLFLGENADFPAGPFLLAAKRNIPTITIHVMKHSAKIYKIYVRKLDASGDNAQQKARSILHAYCENLEEMVRKYPYQWFNFFEFWPENN